MGYVGKSSVLFSLSLSPTGPTPRMNMETRDREQSLVSKSACESNAGACGRGCARAVVGADPCFVAQTMPSASNCSTNYINYRATLSCVCVCVCFVLVSVFVHDAIN